MLMTIDVGNTNITVGIFDKQKLVGNFRLTTGMTRTSDEFGTAIGEILRYNDIEKQDISDAIIASVVPKLMHSRTSGIIKYFEVHPILVEPGVRTGVKIITENPRQIGADRIVNAAGALGLYGGPAIVIDYGTATTYDLVSAEGAYVSGVIAPGIRTSAEALWSRTAKLPEIEIRKPEHILAKETISSMQAGLVYGQIGQTEYIVKHMIAESGYEDIKIVATGGLGNLISKETDGINIYDPELTLQGLRLIYEKEMKNRGADRYIGEKHGQVDITRTSNRKGKTGK